MVSSRKQASVDAAVAALRGEGLAVAGTACHVGDPAALTALVRFTLDTYGALDILVSNAAVNPASGPILDMEASARGGGAGVGAMGEVLPARRARSQAGPSPHVCNRAAAPCRRPRSAR